jgi:hypothetical protein
MASLLAPENCRYHAASKVIRFTNPVALPVRESPIGRTTLCLCVMPTEIVFPPYRNIFAAKIVALSFRSFEPTHDFWTM